MSETEGRIRSLTVFKERGKPGDPVERSRFIKDLGMDGDRHAGGGERQAALLAGEVRDWMDRQEEPGLCFRRYKANIETEGLDVTKLAPGTVLRAGTAVFQVSESHKECFAECRLFREKKVCRLSSGGIFLKVIETGEVSNNDKIAIGGILK